MLPLKHSHVKFFQNEKELQSLFNQLDVNHDNRICIDDIVCALRQIYGDDCDTVFLTNKGERFLVQFGIPKNGSLTFDQFSTYVLRHDQVLVAAFDYLDKNKTGTIDTEDVRIAFQRFGTPLGHDEAERLLKRVDRAGNHLIDFREWRQFLLFQPVKNLSEIFKHWRHDSFLDVGSDTAVGVPEDYSLSEKSSGKQLLQLTAGAIAGAVSRSCTAPIDRLKLMRQVYGYKHKNSGFVEAYMYMIREGGLHSLWRGNAINVVKFAPETAIKYGTYEHYKRWLTTARSTDHWLELQPLVAKFLAGSMAGSTAQTMIYPLEVLKTRMCLRKTGQYRSLWHCAATVYQEGGIGSFYRGYGVNLMGIVPYAGIELAMYERCKTAYIERFMSLAVVHAHSDDDCPSSRPVEPSHLVTPPLYVIPVLASFSSTCAIVVTYPTNLIRAKLQAAYYSQTSGRKITALHLVRTILRDDGVAGLYRGLLTNLLKVVPAVGISLATYETLRRHFHLGPLGSG